MYKKSIIIAVFLSFILVGAIASAQSEQHIYGGRGRYGWSISNLDENITYNYTFEITFYRFRVLHHFNESGNATGLISCTYLKNLPRFAKVEATLKTDNLLMFARGFVIFKFVWFRELEITELTG